MARSILYLLVQLIAAFFALNYLQSFYAFYTTHQVSFVGYTATDPLAIWTVRNLGVRLLAIAVGFLVALLSRSKSMLALMFAVRLAADLGDLINSATTPGLDAFVPQILGVFASIEALCLLCLLWLRRSE
ncbi:MAG: hypothetical protein K1X75_01695 [Leptospirales bacterium]|nr:hypothetical protein [Leptospirales bacterium]